MKSYVAIILVIFVVTFGAIKLLSNPKNSGQSQSVQTKETNPTSVEASTELVSSNKYIEYSKNTIESTSAKRRVLFFYANWCPTCIPADKDFKSNLEKIPEDVVVIRVNYNDTETDEEEKELARKYTVTYQHTFVQLDSSGNKIKIWNSGQTEELLAKLQ